MKKSKIKKKIVLAKIKRRKRFRQEVKLWIHLSMNSITTGGKWIGNVSYFTSLLHLKIHFLHSLIRVEAFSYLRKNLSSSSAT
jgi:hypothetical protein